MGGKNQTVTTQNQLPKSLQQAYDALLNMGVSVAKQPLQQYGGPTTAGFTPDQIIAFNNIGRNQGSATPFINSASQYAAQGAAPINVQDMYAPKLGMPGQIDPRMVGGVPDIYNQRIAGAPQIDAQNVGSAPGINAQNISPDQFSAGGLQQYMDPYQQSVVDATMANINKNNAIQQNDLLGQSISQGASPFAGDRAGVASAELARNQALASNQTIAGLMSQGYGQALGEFNNQQQAGMAAQGQNASNNLAAQGQNAANYMNMGQFNAANNLAAQGQNASNFMNVGQWNAANNLTAQGQTAANRLAMSQANASNDLAAQGQNIANRMNTRQFNVTNDMNSQLNNAQLGLQADQFNNQSAANASNQMAGLGQLAQTTGLNDANALLQIGQLQQNQNQSQLTSAYQQFLQQQGYPAQQTQFLANLIYGMPNPGGTQTTTQPGPSWLSQLGGLGMAGLGLYNMFNKGGRVPGYQDGGLTEEQSIEMAGLGGLPGFGGMSPPQMQPPQMSRPEPYMSWRGPPNMDGVMSMMGADRMGGDRPISSPPRYSSRGIPTPMMKGTVKPPIVHMQPYGLKPLNPNAYKSRTYKMPKDILDALNAFPHFDTFAKDKKAEGGKAEGGFNPFSSKWLPLVTMGLGIAGSKSPFPLQAIGEGGLAGLQAAQQMEDQKDAGTQLITTGPTFMVYHPGTGEIEDTKIPNPAYKKDKATPYSDYAKIEADRASGLIDDAMAKKAIDRLDVAKGPTPYTDAAKIQADHAAGLISDDEAANSLKRLNASKQPTPYTDIAKIQADHQAGLITDDQAVEAVKKLNAPKQATPYTNAAKIQADVASGLLSQEEAAKQTSALGASARPATEQEKIQYGVDKAIPLFIDKDGTPKILSAGGVNINLSPNGVEMPVVPLTDRGTPDPDAQAQFLATLDPSMAQMVKSIGNYQLDIQKVTSLRGDQRQKLAQLVAQYDPTFDMSQYGARAAMRKSITSGNYSQSLNSANLVIQHLDALQNAIKGLDNSDYPMYNAAKNKVKQEMGDPSITAFDTIRSAAGSELAKVFKGTGATDVSQINEWAGNLDRNGSPEQIKTSIHTAIGLLKSRIDTIRTQYESAMGHPADFAFLTPHSEKVLLDLGVDPKEIDPNAPDVPPDDTEKVVSPEGGQSPVGAPPVGTVEDGFRFKGGDPADKSNWEPVK